MQTFRDNEASLCCITALFLKKSCPRGGWTQANNDHQDQCNLSSGAWAGAGVPHGSVSLCWCSWPPCTLSFWLWLSCPSPAPHRSRTPAPHGPSSLNWRPDIGRAAFRARALWKVWGLRTVHQNWILASLPSRVPWGYLMAFSSLKEGRLPLPCPTGRGGAGAFPPLPYPFFLAIYLACCGKDRPRLCFSHALLPESSLCVKVDSRWVMGRGPADHPGALAGSFFKYHPVTNSRKTEQYVDRTVTYYANVCITHTGH